MLAVLKRIQADPTPPTDGEGRWPSTREQFLWDLAPDPVAQDGDGVIAPSWGPPTWVDGVTDPKEIARMLQVSRTYRKDTEETIRNLELKAARLATVLVALLTANVALIVFQITRLGSDPGPLRTGLVVIGVAFGLVSAAYLLVGLTRAVDADQRMGITSRSGLGDVAKEPRKAMEHEAVGYAVSNWTRQNKASRLIYARAAVSRSMVFLIISALIAIALAVLSTLQKDAAGAIEHQTPAQHQSTDREPDGTPSGQPIHTSTTRQPPQHTNRATPRSTAPSTAPMSKPGG